jgi:MYXO-CTERM domain-containing protein
MPLTFASPVRRAAAAALPLALAALTLAAPRAAAACSPDFCAELPRWGSIGAGDQLLIPTDGVFVLKGDRGGEGDAGATIPAITATVTRDGVAIEGSLEPAGLQNLLIWRPAAPLTPGATYTLALTIDNAAIAEDNFGCGLDLLEAELTYTIGDGPAPPLTFDFSAAESVTTQEILALDQLVCCDGAYPEQTDICGFKEISWSEGRCASEARRGTLHVNWMADALPPAHAGSLLFRAVIDGDARPLNYFGASHSAQAPFCGRAEAVSLIDGAVVAATDGCFGEAPEAPLGLYEVDPLEALVECVGAPYTCETFFEQWDANACTPVPTGDPETTTGDPETTTGDPDTTTADPDTTTADPDSATATAGADDPADKGCACASGPAPSPSAAFAALLLLALSRRKPRKRQPLSARPGSSLTRWSSPLSSSPLSSSPLSSSPLSS